MALGLGILGFGSWPLRAIAVEPREAPRIVGPAANPPEVGTSGVTSFVGNPELKARLDLPGKLTVASERVHDQLLRRFYTAHGYQTVWTNHKLEASRLWNAVMLAGKQGLDPSLFHGTSLAARSSTLSTTTSAPETDCPSRCSTSRNESRATAGISHSCADTFAN